MTRPLTFTGRVARRAIDVGMRLELEGVEVWADEWRERCATTIQAAGAYVIVVETVVPGRSGRAELLLPGRPRRRHGGVAPAPARRGRRTVFSQRVLNGMAGRDARARVPARARGRAAAILDPNGDEALHVELSDAALARAAGRVAHHHSSDARPVHGGRGGGREQRVYRRGRGDRDGARGVGARGWGWARAGIAERR